MYSDDPCKDADRYLSDLDSLEVCSVCGFASDDVIDDKCKECRVKEGNNGN